MREILNRKAENINTRKVGLSLAGDPFPPRGATENCSVFRVETNTNTLTVTTRLCDRPAYEQPRHIMWLMTLNDSGDNATASAGAEAHMQTPTSVKSMRKYQMQGRYRGKLLFQTFHNAGKSRMAALNVDTLLVCSWLL